ncbi:MAG: OB-fold nucleic acid binding domain-containing protein, partial [Gammaproteobacteria bacterium]
HPIDQYESELKQFTHGKIASLQADVERSRGKMEARVAGLVIDIRTRQSKSGKTMAFAVIDDRTGRLEIAAYSEVYEKYRNILSRDTLLVAEGSLMIDDFTGTLRLTAEKLYSIEEARDAFARGLQLTWSAIDHGNAIVRKLSPELMPFKGGGCPILINYNSGQAQAVVRLGDEWRVTASDELILRLKRLLGTSAVDVKYR